MYINEFIFLCTQIILCTNLKNKMLFVYIAYVSYWKINVERGKINLKIANKMVVLF